MYSCNNDNNNNSKYICARYFVLSGTVKQRKFVIQIQVKTARNHINCFQLYTRT